MPSDINILGENGARLRIVTWDELPHLQFKIGAKECWHRITWDEFRKLALGEPVREVLPWFDDHASRNFLENGLCVT